MPQFSSFTLADGQATPVTRTFSPASLNNGLAVWTDRSAGALALQPKVTLKVASNGRATGVARVQESLAVPYVNAAGETRFCRFNGEYLIPNDAPQSAVNDVYALAKNLNSSSNVSTCVTTREAMH